MTTIETILEQPLLDDPRPGGTTRTFAEGALATGGAPIELARRAAAGLALASIAGLAMGLREGPVAMAVHAAGVPLALGAVAALGGPSLYVVLALFDAPLDPRAAAAAAARGIAAAGLVLAGLAPAIAVFVVTSATLDGAALASGVALVAGGAIGLGHVLRVVGTALERADSATRGMATLVLIGFAIFAIALASRVWGSLLPVLAGGAS